MSTAIRPIVGEAATVSRPWSVVTVLVRASAAVKTWLTVLAITEDWSSRCWVSSTAVPPRSTTAAAAAAIFGSQRRERAASRGVTFGGSWGWWSAAARIRARRAGGGARASLAPIRAAASCSSRTSSRQAAHPSRCIEKLAASSALRALTA